MTKGFVIKFVGRGVGREVDVGVGVGVATLPPPPEEGTCGVAETELEAELVPFAFTAFRVIE